MSDKEEKKPTDKEQEENSETSSEDAEKLRGTIW